MAIWYKLTDKTRYGMYISIVGAIVTIIFNYVMIPKIGFMASAWATLLAYGSMMLISYQMGKKYYPVPYDIFRISGYLVFSTIISAVSYYFFNEDYFISTVLVLVFLTIIFLLERNEIKQLLKK